MEDLIIRKIDDHIEEFFFMKAGERINDPDEKILFSEGIFISRRALKHIVERRSSNDKLDIEHLKYFFRAARNTLTDPEVIIENNRDDTISFLLGRFDLRMNKGIMVVIESFLGEKEKQIVTIFRKDATQFLKLKNNP